LAGGTGRGRPELGFRDFLETGVVVGFFVGLEVACVVALGALSLLEIVFFLKKALVGKKMGKIVFLKLNS